MIRALVVVLLAANLSTARAQDREAGEPKDEKEFSRQGFAIGVGLGPARFSANKANRNVRGGGGNFMLRFGTSAGDKLLWFAQLDSATRNETSGLIGLSLGAHYYLRETIWLGGGIGVASFYRRAEDPLAEGKDQSQGSLALNAVAGVDVYRRGIFAVDVELSLLRGGGEGGGVLTSALLLAVNWY